MDTSVKFIGTVNSTLKRLEDCPRQEKENAPAASIIIFPEFAEGIKDIQPGDEILLLTWMHLADRGVTACHPRNDESLPMTGVFSTRSPDRPNPIGLHKVKVVSIKKDLVEVSALEVLDQTPLIDIKPLI